MKKLIALLLALTLAVGMTVPTYAASCKHRRTSKECYKTKYIESTEQEHIRKKYYKEICDQCNKTLDRWTEEKEFSHRFDENTCTKCGYEKASEDNTIVLKDGSKTVYVNGEKTRWQYAPEIINGTTMVPLVITVETLGGQYLDWDNYSSTATVELNGTILEYQKNNKKYWLDGKRRTANQAAQIIDDKLYVELKTLLKATDYVANYYDGYVVIASEWASQEEIEQAVNYLFGKTSSNDYEDPPNTREESSTPNVDLSEIKAGKVYATDNMHLYKRTYDPTKALNYDDIYICTLSNFSLPKNSVFTLHGEYLYKAGKKVSASPTILQEADKRINQLNKIIDGANNAYNARTIDKSRRNTIKSEAESTISEYQKVMEGSKKLNKVSEVAKSYKAKVGDSNSTVKVIQQKLYDLGFSSQLVTGNYGEITFNNIAYFQMTNNCTVTGWVDNTTYKKLMASSTNVSSELQEIEKLNTLPLSKTDIAKGVTVVTVGANQYYDCTEVLNDVFVKCAEEAKQHEILYPDLLELTFSSVSYYDRIVIQAKLTADLANLAWFVFKVDNDQEWDLKRKNSWETTVGTTYPGRNGAVMFFGKLYTISELGNLLYGYTGTAMKIPEEILYMAGGLVATKSLEFIILEDYGDSEDRPLIKEGIEWYKKAYQ